MNRSIIEATDHEILEVLGGRLRALRRGGAMTVTLAARLAGLDRTTVHRAEAGDNATLLTLVRLLRVYGRLPALEEFLRLPEISPMDLVRGAGQDRRG